MTVNQVQHALQRSRIVSVTSPRQRGQTPIAWRLAKVYAINCFDWGNPLASSSIRADAPRMTRSIRSAIEDLELEKVLVIYPGTKRYPIADSVEAVPLAQLATPGGLSAYLPP